MTILISEVVKYAEKSFGFKNQVKWSSCSLFIFYHIFGFLWCYAYAFPAKIQTIVFAVVMVLINAFGIAGGVHRLWTHKSYKARSPLNFFLVICYCCAGQNSIYEWVRDHRLHHKFSDTDADPHNSKRGLFFSHIGWLMMKKNDQVIENGKKVNMSDIEGDALLMFQHKYSTYINITLCHIIPFLISTIVLNEEWKCAVAWQSFIRFLYVFHAEMTVNSLAHAYGYKLYNKQIPPVQNTFVSLYTLGEGDHNYHHVFPHDYKAAEYCDIFNATTFYINCFAKLGLAYDLREPSPEVVKAVVARLNSDNCKLENSGCLYSEEHASDDTRALGR